MMSLVVVAGWVLALSAAATNAATISEDFESSVGSTPPSGWSLVIVHNSPTPTYGTVAGYVGGGLGGQITANSWNGTHDHLPGAYIVNSGSVAFDATQPITGRFDFRVDDPVGQDFYAAANFIMGDIKTGFTGADAGQLVGAHLGKNTFGAKGTIIDGTAADLVGTINLAIATWYQVEFSWTPTGGTTGNFSYTVKNTGGSTVGSLTTPAAVTLGSSDVYFGFGAGQPSAYGPALGTFDNINIIGTEVPEPATMSLLALGGLGILARRRRR